MAVKSKDAEAPADVAQNGSANGEAAAEPLTKLYHGKAAPVKKMTIEGRDFFVPYEKLIDPLDLEEEDALVASIKDMGILVPVSVTREDVVIAGHNRLRIWCKRLRRPLSEIPLHVVDDPVDPLDQKAEIERVFASQFLGRRMTRERRAHAAHTLTLMEWSAHRIANLLGCDHTTILDDLSRADPLGDPAEAEAAPKPKSAKVKGADGRLYDRKKPAKPEKAKPEFTPRQVEKRAEYKSTGLKIVGTLMRVLDRLDLGDRFKARLEAVQEALREV
jgi:hypothetical protein